MELQPKRPPGRADRKGAAYALEIVRLRGAGYTYEAIREAMAEIGIELSTSALRREVRRLQRWSNSPQCDPRSDRRSTAAQTLNIAATSGPAPSPSVAAPHGSHGHQIAEAFFDAHPSNPLVRTKEFP